MPFPPEISIIMPVFNSAEFVRTTLASALAQSFGNLEVVCVDDGSTDDSRAILAQVAAEDARVRIAGFESNRGASSARNEGIEQARGDYVFFLDSDDFLPTMALEHLLAATKATGCEIAIGKLHWTKNPEVAARFESPIAPGPVMVTSLQESTYLQYVSGSHCCNLYRKDLLDRHRIRYDTDLTYGEDQLFQASAIAAAGRVAMLDEVVYVYHHYRGQSITRMPPTLGNLLDDLEFHRRIARLLNSQGLEAAGTDFLRTWPYSIREYWLRIPEAMTLAEAMQFFSAFRTLIAEFDVCPWNESTPENHLHLLSLVLESRDTEAYAYLATDEARQGRATSTSPR